MNLLAVFCYVTVTCDYGTTAEAQRPNASPNLSESSGDGRKSVRQTSSYPTRYDYIDVETVLKNERILRVLFNCVINRGPCTREGLELKSKSAAEKIFYYVSVFISFRFFFFYRLEFCIITTLRI